MTTKDLSAIENNSLNNILLNIVLTHNNILHKLILPLLTEDTTAPTIVDCPPDMVSTTEENSGLAPVVWREPTATDASGNVTMLVRTHEPGESFQIGTDTVLYIFADPSNNVATCSFYVRVNRGNKSLIPSKYSIILYYLYLYIRVMTT